jgi:phosphate starvation-inducible protein PhoH and related proteins
MEAELAKREASTKRTSGKAQSNSRVERNQFLTQSTYEVQAREEYPNARKMAAQKRKPIDLVPRNLTQERYCSALEDRNQNIVFAMGPAGTGKTLLATMYAIKALRAGTIDKIVITRPAVSVDEQHGFLPGTLIEKMAPWVIPIMDVFKEYYHPTEIIKMMEDELIEIAPLAYMRGRTLKNCVIIADELQNATPSQMKMLLTRIGDGGKIIATGDVNQHDRGFEKNGLKDFVERMDASPTKSKHMTIIKFGSNEVERHPIIEEVLSLYGDID